MIHPTLAELTQSCRAPDPALLYWYTLLSRLSYYVDAPTVLRGCEAVGAASVTLSTNPLEQLPTWFHARFQQFDVIGVAGTPPNLDAWIGNVLGSSQGTTSPFPGKTHRYFAANALILATNMRTVLSALLPLQPLLIIGHSLGGAISLMLPYYVLQSLGPSVLGVVAFGCPKAGDIEFSTANSWPVIRLSNDGDPVASLPPFTASQIGVLADVPAWGPCEDYAEVGQGYTWDYPGNLYPTQRRGLDRAVLALVQGVTSVGFTEGAVVHLIVNYAERCRRWIDGNFPPVNQRGVDVVSVDKQQQALSNGEGFNWSP